MKDSESTSGCETSIMMMEEAKKQVQWHCLVKIWRFRTCGKNGVIFQRDSVVVLMLKIPAPSCCLRLFLSHGIAAGVRRIEALTGKGVLEYYKKQETSS